ncbi:5019_t:CDS:2 [Diversispora eburnea]|uniref:5019_t:CDS:1 n=1 Tax=Diversispora eburnea TaxID=1213867 RepID=A0A9N8YPB3_9GLOM|nr:5019_t:CDS:2 [Diversispora eburnea]
MSSSKLIKPIRLFFLTSPRTITTVEESQAIFSFFNSKGELNEFKLHREPYDKKTCKYGWASYRDNEIAKNEIRKQIPLSRRQPRFNGFYIKRDEPLISKRITTEQRTDSSEKINTTINESIKEFPITEPINSVNTKTTFKTSNLFESKLRRIFAIRDSVGKGKNNFEDQIK